MTLQDIRKLLEAAGMPVAYDHFPADEPQELPFICYLEAGTNNFAADGAAHAIVRRIHAELYTTDKDPAAEERLEAALSGIFWNKSETYLDAERMYMIVYEMEV